MDKREVFLNDHYFLRFLVSIKEFNSIQPIASLEHVKRRGLAPPAGGAKPLQKLVEIICYTLLPNHFHFCLKQLVDGGVSEFMKRLSGGYTTYFNQKNNRTGSLFQGTFKAVHLATDEQLLYLSAYVHGNSEIHKIAKAEDYRWSSYPNYFANQIGLSCNKEVVMSQFKNTKEYQEYVQIVIKEASARKDEVKKYLLD
ncbi:MAG: transposase [Candidatus Gracilibacteria bacterium]